MPGDMVRAEISAAWEAAREVQQGFLRSRALLIHCLDYGARCRQVQSPQRSPNTRRGIVYPR